MQKDVVKFFLRVWRALHRDEDVFFEIGLDKKANWQAFGLTVLSGVLGGLRWVLGSEQGFYLLGSLLVSAVVAWFIFAGSIRFMEMVFTGGEMDRKELLRLAGFSTPPLALLSIPYVGWISLIWFWSLIYTGLRSLYSTKPWHTLALMMLGSLVAFVAWGIFLLVAYTLLTGWD